MDNAQADAEGARLESQRWARIFRTGLAANIALVILTLGYVALTPAGPHRGLITALTVLFLASLMALAIAPAERIAGATWRMPFFHAWSITCLVLTLLLVWLDGGVESPTLLYLYMIMIFASLAYPVLSNVAYAAAGLCGFVLVALTQPVDPGFNTGHLFRFLLLALAYGFSVSVAHNHSALADDNGRMRRQLVDMARRDDLTGCLNRRGFSEHLEHEIARSRRTDSPLSLLRIDVDHFKDVNDRFGHLQGDEVLRGVAALLRGEARSADVVGRLGGDEFVILAPDTGASAAMQLARRLLLRAADLELPCPITLSIGACATVCRPGTGSDDLLACADKALYDVKRRGRNDVQVTEMRPLGILDTRRTG